ncbi:MAG: hypothetical protein QM767_11560 [Anaeromyxobacter sp.]
MNKELSRREAIRQARTARRPSQRPQPAREEVQAFEADLEIAAKARMLSPAQLQAIAARDPGFLPSLQSALATEQRFRESTLRHTYAEEVAKRHQDMATDDPSGIWAGTNPIARGLRDPEHQATTARFLEQNRISWQGYPSPSAALFAFAAKVAMGRHPSRSRGESCSSRGAPSPSSWLSDSPISATRRRLRPAWRISSGQPMRSGTCTS